MASLDIYLGLFTIAVLRDENYYGATHTDHDRSVEGKEQFRWKILLVILICARSPFLGKLACQRNSDEDVDCAS